MDKKVPQPTIQAFSRSIYKEATKYGFSQIDVIKLINELMGLCSETGDESELVDAELSAEIDHSMDQVTELPLKGSDIHIRAYAGESDRALFEKWLPDRYGRFFVLSCATAQEVTIDSLADSGRNQLGIITLPDGTPVGAMAYLDHSHKQKRAELRKLIGEPEARGKGFAAAATRMWIQYGIHGLGLEKIYVSTLQTQIANIKLNEKIGFQVEGLLTNEVLIDGERCDVLRMGLSAKSS